MVRYLIPLLIFVLMIGLFLVGMQYDPHRVPSPLIDKPAPLFELPQLEDAELTLSNRDMQGEVVMLNVWASWCVACLQEQPLLVELAHRGDIDIFGLNYKDNRQDALQWLARHGDPYVKSAFDEQGRVGIDFGVYGVPETYILDKKGVIRYKHIGPLSRDDIKSTVLPLFHKLSLQEPEVES
ncbi:MAG: DsbE family thiol:disulfide interchange protein [Gammaproteobacteria bacterium]